MMNVKRHNVAFAVQTEENEKRIQCPIDRLFRE